jgi:hypothetical protein
MSTANIACDFMTVCFVRRVRTLNYCHYTASEQNKAIIVLLGLFTRSGSECRNMFLQCRTPLLARALQFGPVAFISKTFFCSSAPEQTPVLLQLGLPWDIFLACAKRQLRLSDLEKYPPHKQASSISIVAFADATINFIADSCCCCFLFVRIHSYLLPPSSSFSSCLLFSWYSKTRVATSPSNLDYLDARLLVSQSI